MALSHSWFEPLALEMPEATGANKPTELSHHRMEKKWRYKVGASVLGTVICKF